MTVPPDLEQVRRALGGGRPPSPPAGIRQQAFDYDEAHLFRLADPGAVVGESDGIDYALDLRYTPIQRDLFSFAFPRLLRLWRDALWTQESAFSDEFHATLCATRLPLNDREAAAVHGYMSGVILERMDAADSLARRPGDKSIYPLFVYLALTGVYMPDIRPLWECWWGLTTKGRARVALQWASCLRYRDTANPIWPPWTPAQGGGPPSLWMNHGLVFGTGWTESNAEFIRSTFSVRWLLERVSAAARALRGSADEEVAAGLDRDCRESPGVINRRLRQLPGLLTQAHDPGIIREFSDVDD